MDHPPEITFDPENAQLGVDYAGALVDAARDAAQHLTTLGDLTEVAAIARSLTLESAETVFATAMMLALTAGGAVTVTDAPAA